MAIDKYKGLVITSSNPLKPKRVSNQLIYKTVLRKRITIIFLTFLTLVIFFSFTAIKNNSYLECRDLPIVNKGNSDQLDYFGMSMGFKIYNQWVRSFDNLYFEEWINDLDSYSIKNKICFDAFKNNIIYVQERFQNTFEESRFGLRPWGYPMFLSFFLDENLNYFKLRISSFLTIVLFLFILLLTLIKITDNKILSIGLLNVYLVISFLESFYFERISIFSYQFIIVTEPLSILIMSLIVLLFVRKNNIGFSILMLFVASYFIKQMNLFIFIFLIGFSIFYSLLKKEKFLLKTVLLVFGFVMLSLPIFQYNLSLTNNYSLMTGVGGWRDMPASFSLEYKTKDFYQLRSELLANYKETNGLDAKSDYIETAVLSRELFFSELKNNLSNVPSLFVFKLSSIFFSFSVLLTFAMLVLYIFYFHLPFEKISNIIFLYFANLIFICITTPADGRHVFQLSFIYLIIFAYIIKLKSLKN